MERENSLSFFLLWQEAETENSLTDVPENSLTDVPENSLALPSTTSALVGSRAGVLFLDSPYGASYSSPSDVSTVHDDDDDDDDDDDNDDCDGDEGDSDGDGLMKATTTMMKNCTRAYTRTCAAAELALAYSCLGLLLIRTHTPANRHTIA